MKTIKLLTLGLILFSFSSAHATTIFGTAANPLPIDGNDIPIQLFAPDPAKSQVNTAMTGTVTFKVGSGGTVDITNWIVLCVSPTADSTYYFNSDSTKTYPLRSLQDNYISVRQLAKGKSVTLILGAATASVQGM